jgi:hypothetical protein
MGVAAASDSLPVACSVDSSLWVLRLLPPLKLVAMIVLKVALSTKKSINQKV